MMKELWDQFEAWLTVHWPDGLASLNPPATDEELALLEDALGAKLPEDFSECLRVHNGQSDSAGGLFDNSKFLSTGAILEEWKVWKDLLDSGEFEGIHSEPEDGIKSDWWNASWIPMTHNGCGDHYCIDLAPARGGHRGQVITMWHDMLERRVQAKTFGEWFQNYVAAVINGEYTYAADFGGLVKKGQA